MTTTKTYIPKGLRSVNPYLTVDDAAAVIDFTVKALGGEVRERHEDGGRIAHAVVEIDGSAVEISDARDEWPALQAGLHVYVPDVDAAHARALTAGAEELYPPSDHEYGERGSAVRGPCGIQWYLATARPAN